MRIFLRYFLISSLLLGSFRASGSHVAGAGEGSLSVAKPEVLAEGGIPGLASPPSPVLIGSGDSTPVMTAPEPLMPSLLRASHERARSDNADKTLAAQVDAVSTFAQSRIESTPRQPENIDDLSHMLHLLAVFADEASYLESQDSYTGVGMPEIKEKLSALRAYLVPFLRDSAADPHDPSPAYADFLNLKRLIHKISQDNYISWWRMIAREFPKIHTVAPVSVEDPSSPAASQRLIRFARRYEDVRDPSAHFEHRKADEKYQTFGDVKEDGRTLKSGFRRDLVHLGKFRSYFFKPEKDTEIKGVIIDYYGGHTKKDDLSLRANKEKIRPFTEAGFVYVMLRTEDILNTIQQRQQFVSDAGKELLNETLATVVYFTLHVREKYPGKPVYYTGTSFGAAKGAILNALQSAAIEVQKTDSRSSSAADGGGNVLGQVRRSFQNRLVSPGRVPFDLFFRKIHRIRLQELASLFDGYLFFSGGLKYMVGGTKYTKSADGKIEEVSVEKLLRVSPTHVPVFVAQNADDERAPLADAMEYVQMIMTEATAPVWLHVTPQGAASPVQNGVRVATSNQAHGLPRSQLMLANLMYRVMRFLESRGEMSSFERVRMERHFAHTSRILSAGSPRSPSRVSYAGDATPEDSPRAEEDKAFDESFDLPYILRRYFSLLHSKEAYPLKIYFVHNSKSVKGAPLMRLARLAQAVLDFTILTEEYHTETQFYLAFLDNLNRYALPALRAIRDHYSGLMMAAGELLRNPVHLYGQTYNRKTREVQLLIKGRDTTVEGHREFRTAVQSQILAQRQLVAAVRRLDATIVPKGLKGPARDVVIEALEFDRLSREHKSSPGARRPRKGEFFDGAPAAPSSHVVGAGRSLERDRSEDLSPPVLE